LPRSFLAALIVVLSACGDPGFSIVVTRPIAQRIGRACVAAALAADPTFKGIDSVAKPWIVREDSGSIGLFSWSVAGRPYAEIGELNQRFGVGADTLVASLGRLGIAEREDIRRAEQELSTRVNAVAEQCGRPLAPARCVFSATGRGPVPCAGVP